MIQCPTCKQVVEPGARFCPHDGTPLTPTSAAAVPTPTGQRPPSQQIELPVVVGGRYRLVEFRGGGGMAKVYRAIDLTLEREVAVKLINPELRAEQEFDSRFQREARIASQLADPHIVVVHDFGIDPTHGPFLVMEYVQGQSLRERLATQGPMPLRAGLQLGAQLLLALIHAHTKNIVHRDIKPDNILLLNQSGVRLHVRVLDFGIARIYGQDEPNRAEALTGPGSVLGTPRYMSPEQLAGRPVDARSDLYSAALVIHEALTTELPYVSGKRLCELCPEATPALQELLDQCLRPNPAERPVSAVEVYLRLQELGKASGILLLPPGALDRLAAARQASQPTVAYPTPAAPRRRRGLLIGLGVLFLAALVVVAVVVILALQEPTIPPEESLLGVKIGDPKPEVVERLRLAHDTNGDPWQNPPSGGVLGHLLQPEDLRVPAAARDRLDVRWTREEDVCVLFHEDRVRAVVARRRGAATARGVRVAGSVAALHKRYRENPTDVKGVRVGPELIEVHRYDTLGVGFEVEDGSISSITLYPPTAEK